MFDSRSRKIAIVALLMIAFGILEMIAAFYFTQKYFIFGIYLYEALALDALYFVSALLLLTMKRRAATIAILLMVANTVGRVALILTGMYPFNEQGPGIAMIAGTLMAGVFAFYIWTQYDGFY